MAALPDEALTSDRPTTLRRARTPTAFLGDMPGLEASSDGAALIDIAIAGGKIASVTPAGPAPLVGDIDLGGRHVWPTLIDMHAHLDKGHIVDRTTNPDGTHVGALTATTQDRETHWRRDDLLRRMTFGLRCAEAHGVSAIRTHLDSQENQGPETWRAYAELRAAWNARVALQAVALVPMDVYRTPYATELADIVAANGGLMGGVARATGGRIEDETPDFDDLLDRMFALARERDLDVDLHVDESGFVRSAALPHVARATLRHGYEGRVTCGHCCSLALQDEATTAEHIALVAKAGVAIVTLPTVNMYLQDRIAGRTPRWRGVTPVRELLAGGVRVAVAGDNCRDPFYAYGDHDMLDTWREGVKILHLDHPYGDGAALAAPAPAAIAGFAGHGSIAEGAAANLIIMNVWTMDQVLARPQADRIVIRNGQRLGLTPPSYDEL